MSLGYEVYGSLCNICSSSFWWLACLKQTKSTFCWGFPESMVAPYCKHFYVVKSYSIMAPTFQNCDELWSPYGKLTTRQALAACLVAEGNGRHGIKKANQKQLFDGWKHVFRWLIPIRKNKFSFNHRVIWGKKTSHKFLQKKPHPPGTRIPIPGGLVPGGFMVGRGAWELVVDDDDGWWMQMKIPLSYHEKMRWCF